MMTTCCDSTLADTLDCPICFEQFLSPRRLPCLHTICQKCLEILINQQGRCGQCPLCNGKFAPPDRTTSKDKWASAFPFNELIQSIIESKIKCDHEENYCEPCGRKEKVPAEFWCVNCQEKLCKSCNEYHTCQKLMKDHKTVSISEREKNIQRDITLDQNCTQHPGHKFETVCVTHRALCCSVCFATIHRDCNDIRDISAVAEDQTKRFIYREVIEQISQIKTEIAKILTDKLDNRSQLQKEQEQIIHDMDIRIDQIIENLNALRVSFKIETDHVYRAAKSCIEKSEKQIKCFQTTITNAQQILESLEDRIAAREKFIVFENLHSQVTSHYEQLKSTSQDDVEIHLSLKANTALRDIKELDSLGAIQTSSRQPESFKNTLETVDNAMKKLSSMSKLSTTFSAAQIAKPMTSRLAFVKFIKTDKYGSRTRFSGGTVLPDGRLLLVDYNNDRLVELDEQYNMVTDYELDEEALDVTAAQKNNEIYVTVDENGGGIYVYKCSLDNGLTVVRRIKAPPRTRGIAVSGDNIIVGTVDAVVILNQDGTTVESIPRSGEWSYVAASQTQRTMYYTDKHDVVCRRLEGSELFRYQHQQLEWPMGICTDTHGRTYICGLGSNNVHQVSPDGKTSTVLELHTISRPNCCVFLPQRNELLVTSDSEDTALEVYKLE